MAIGDGAVPSGSAGDPGPTRVPVGGVTPQSVPGDGEAPSILLRPGQVVQATVLADLGGGRIRVGAFGITFEAATASPFLVAGADYRFRVGAGRNPITLELLGGARSSGSKTQAGLGSGAGLATRLGLSQRLQGWLSLQANREGAPAAGARATVVKPTVPLPQPGARPKVDAAALRAFVTDLGHDLEARVAERSLSSLGERGDPSRQAAQLKATAKARALTFLSEFQRAPSDDPAVVRQVLAAREFVETLGSLERENVRRREFGGPTVVPLPVDPEQGLREARLYWLLEPGRTPEEKRAREKQQQSEDDDGARSKSAPRRDFTAVLMLDFTRLGPVRVDLKVSFARGDDDPARVQASFTTPRSPALLWLREGFAELTESLEALGLQIDDLSVRVPRDAALPTADLAPPPPRARRFGDGSRSIIDFDA